MCGPTAAQSQAQAQEADLSSLFALDFKQAFSGNQAILSSLTSALEPIVAAGPNQQGFSQPQLTNLQSEATNTSAQGAQNAEIAANAKAGAAGGGSAMIPSGATDQIGAMINESAGQNLSQEQEQIQQENYATGRQNFFTAEGDLASAPGQLENPVTAMGTAATNSSEAAMAGATQIQQAQDAWMAPVFGMIGSVGGAALGKVKT